MEESKRWKTDKVLYIWRKVEDVVLSYKAVKSGRYLSRRCDKGAL